MSESPSDLTYRKLPARRVARVLVIVALVVTGIGSYSRLQHRQQIMSAANCDRQEQCFRSTEQIDFPTYGNVYPSNLPDCLFAAAADWRIVVRHQTPSSADVIADYRRATTGGSIPFDDFYRYWTQHGIAGQRITGWHTINMVGVDDVESAVRKDKALLVIFIFHDGDTVGGVRAGVGGHAAIIDGYSSKGPLVVTWGTTYQMTWSEYWTSVRSLYAIER
ncbi:MAG: hypothetical protein WCL31_03670 [Actinomycetes bacterium]